MKYLKIELIKKHLSFGNGDYFKASVKHYTETGKASGSFLMALIAMMDEYTEQQVNKLTTPIVIERSEQFLTREEMDKKWESLRDSGLDHKLEKLD